MTVQLIRADARSLPLADESVDLIVTSPPYWALRSYTDGGEHYAGQIGSEPTPAAYIDSLIQCTAEWMRALKPTGSCFVNLGDKYNSAAGPKTGHRSEALQGTRYGHGGGAKWVTATRGEAASAIPQKSLIGLPWRYAIRCIDDLGLILRAEVIWSKPNSLPESVTDRVRRSHETWFHLARSPRYFSAVDAIREGFAEPSGRPNYGRQRPPAPGGNRGLHVDRARHADHRDMGQNALGKLPGSVWEIASQPLTVPGHLGVDHFAAFPMEWPRRIIQGWSPSGICTACGEGRRSVVERPGKTGHGNNPDGRVRSTLKGGEKEWRLRMANPDRVTGEACACPDTSAPTRPSVVVDPFGGTGTTALVADALGRHCVSVDMSADYLRLGRWRTTDPGERAKALCVPKPPPQANDQLDLFAVEAS